MQHCLPGTDAKWELLVTKSGELFVSALEDTVVSSSTNLGGFGHGFYEVGDGAAKVKAAHQKWMEFAINDDQVHCIFVVNPPLKDKYPETPQTLQHFLMWLEGQGQINIKLVNHNVQRTATDKDAKFTIEPQQPSLFEVQQKFTARVKPSRETVCALLDMTKAKSSKHVRIIQSFTCPLPLRCQFPEHNTFSLTCCFASAISFSSMCRYAKEGNTLKPGHWYLFLTKSVRLTKGKVAQLV